MFFTVILYAKAMIIVILLWVKQLVIFVVKVFKILILIYFHLIIFYGHGFKYFNLVH